MGAINPQTQFIYGKCHWQDCPVYWPKDKEKPLEFGPLTVSLVEVKEDGVTPTITVRDFSIVHSSKVRFELLLPVF